MGGGQIMLMAPAWTLELRGADLPYVGHHDDGDDVAECRPGHPSGRRFCANAAATELRRSGLFAWATCCLVRLQPGCDGLQLGLDRAGLLSETMARAATVSWPRVVLIVAGALSVDPVETGLPYPLPLAACASAKSLAPRRLGSRAGGCAARSLLSRLLLDADGVAVRRRLDEPALDRRPCASGLDRENASLGAVGKPPSWRSTDCMGCVRAQKRALMRHLITLPPGSRHTTFDAGPPAWPWRSPRVVSPACPQASACPTTPMTATIKPAGRGARVERLRAGHR